MSADLRMCAQRQEWLLLPAPLRKCKPPPVAIRLAESTKTHSPGVALQTKRTEPDMRSATRRWLAALVLSVAMLGATMNPEISTSLAPTPPADITSAESTAVDIQSARVATPESVQCYGSSSLNWICDGALQDALPGWNVINNSAGGMTSTAIATAGGVHQMYLSRDVTIPSSGSVQLGIPVGKPYGDEKLGRVVMDAQIGGIKGKLSTRPDLDDPSQLWVFTRDEAGTPASVAKNTPIVSLNKPRAGAVSIFWLGSNDLDDPERVKDDTSRMIDLHQATSNAPFYVVELPPAWGGNEHPLTAHRKNINAWIRQNYGQRVIPLADYLSNGALYDAGIVPSQADRDSIARGLNPRSFWMSESDLTHMNSTGQMVAARYFATFARDGNTYSAAINRFGAKSTARISVTGSKMTVSGHAFDSSDLFASIPVGITVNGVWNATMASRASTHLYEYGIPGRHTYSKTFDVKPGEYSICTVGINFGAGKDYFPPCQTVTVE